MISSASDPARAVKLPPRACTHEPEAVLVVTEWKQFKALDPAETLTKVARPVILDGRNILNPTAWREAGWEYRGMGR